MAANALVQARVRKEVKDEAAAVLAEIGLTVSDAVRLLLIKVACERALPFDPLIPGPITQAAMLESRNAKPGDNPSFATVEEFMAHLSAPD
ncbi:MAG: type II toxin-antitoxin system RelB/DinJ family antitoxin [Nitrosospira sp.]|nr:type II toxin-antitoxin system RelB/DinJ family antitoxin [Nitrosospira sp.]